MKKAGLIKRILLVAVVAMMLFSLVACSGGGTTTTSSAAGGDTSSGSAASGDTSSGATAQSDLKFGYVTTVAGLGDKNMADAAYSGLEMGVKDFGIEFDYVTPTSDSDYVTAQRNFAEGGEYDYILLVTADQQSGIEQNVEEFPDQKWMWFDGPVELPNVRSLYTVWSHQTFLCGVIAGLGTQSDMEMANPDANIVGCILGVENPSLLEGTIGFEAGAKYVNPEVNVIQSNANSFVDAAKGETMAQAIYDQGGDFIQHIAGATGLGVFEAAEKNERYAFGVGSNQNQENPDYIVATSLKDVEGITYSEVKSVVEGEEWVDGFVNFDLKNGGTNYTTEGSNIELPQDIIDAVEDIKQMVIDGEIEVPQTREEMETWLETNTYEK